MVRELSGKHHHRVIHPNQIMIGSHDRHRPNLAKPLLKRKRSTSPISLGLCKTNSLDLNYVPSYEPPLSSFKRNRPTLNRLRPASLILQDAQLSPTQSGSTSSKEKPLILTMFSPISTPPHLTISVPKVLEKSSLNSEPRIHQNQSPLMETGPSHLTLPVMHIFSCSLTEQKSLQHFTTSRNLNTIESSPSTRLSETGSQNSVTCCCPTSTSSVTSIHAPRPLWCHRTELNVWNYSHHFLRPTSHLKV